ncbi:MAG: gliding motility-associated C-terminal domain-containing protein [Chitinophagales bacterium]|nr:gliding motility-associated C-terminal domain-containing protein [Chitinophagales bacterium]
MKRLLSAITLLALFSNAWAQLYINEVSNGPSGAQEYVELVVVGTPNCTGSCVDLRGWIVDDNDGTFATGAGQGIAVGHMRFANVPQWQCVPIGTLIVIYNESDRNPSIPPDNTTGTGCVYILPGSSTLFERSSSTTFTGPYSSGGSWTTQQLNNTNDSYQVRDPLNTSVPFHAVSYNNNSSSTIIYFSGTGGGNVYFMNNSTSNNPSLQANWTRASTTGNETPGAPNNAANAAWINSMNLNCSGTPPTVSLSVSPNDTVCFGDTVIFTATANGTGTFNFSSGYLGSANFDTAIASTTGPVSIIYTNSLGCSDTATINFFVKALPTVTAGPDRTVCVGQAVQLVASSASGGVYLWNDGVANDTNVVNPGTTTTYTVTFTDIVSGCRDIDTVVVNYNPNPTVNAGIDRIICLNDSVVLIATASSSGTFSWDNGVNNDSNLVAPNDTTTYGITFTDGSTGCSSNDFVTVFVNPLPTVDAGNDTAICSGGTAFLNADSPIPGSYLWSTGQTIKNDTVSPLLTTEYFVTLTAGNGCASIDSVTVTVNSPPTVNLGNDTSQCGGSVVLDAGNPGATYAWFPGLSNQQTLTVSTTGSYSVTVTDANGCSGTDNINVTINTLPIVNLGNDTTVCGSSFVLNAGNAGSTYAWSPGGQNSQTITVTITGNYSVIVTDANGCTGTDAINITLIIPPIVSAGNDTSICNGGTAVLNASSSSSGTYTWSTSQSGQSITVSPNATTDYIVSLTVGSGCIDTDTVRVTVNALPNVTANDPTICQGQSAILTATGAVSYTWSTSQTGASITVSPTTNTTYTVTGTDAQGCTATDDAEVTVAPAPIANAGNDQSICPGTSATLTATGGQSYNWSSSQTGASITVSPAASTTYTVTVTDANNCTASDDVTVNVYPAISITANPTNTSCANTVDGSITVNVLAGTAPYTFIVAGSNLASSNSSELFDNLTAATYTANVIDANGCQANLTNILVDSPTPLQYTVDSTNPSCFGLSDGAISVDNASYQYAFDGRLFDTTRNFPNLSAGSYTLVAQDNGCFDTTTIDLTSPAQILVGINPDTATIVEGEIVDLLTAVSGGTSPYTYVWTPDSSLTCGDCANPVASPNDTVTYLLAVTDANGCSSFDSTTIYVLRQTLLSFPTGFTPNGDGSNDLFRPIVSGQLLSYNLRIYNRWGEKVFETNDVKEGWNGTYNGEKQPMGTFAWVVEYQMAATQEYGVDRGNVTLLR